MWSTISGSLPAIVVSLTLAGVGSNVFQTVNKAAVAQHAPPELVGTVMGMSGEAAIMVASACCLLLCYPSLCLRVRVPYAFGSKLCSTETLRKTEAAERMDRTGRRVQWIICPLLFVVLRMMVLLYRFAEGFLRPCVVLFG